MKVMAHEIETWEKEGFVKLKCQILNPNRIGMSYTESSSDRH